MKMREIQTKPMISLGLAPAGRVFESWNLSLSDEGVSERGW